MLEQVEKNSMLQLNIDSVKFNIADKRYYVGKEEKRELNFQRVVCHQVYIYSNS